MGNVFRGPEGLLIWYSECGQDGGEEAGCLFPWWHKVRWAGTELPEDFAPDWRSEPVPKFLFKEANTGRIIGAVR